MRSTRVGLLLVLIPTIGSAAFMWADAAHDTGPAPAPKQIEAPRPADDGSPQESSEGTHSQVPQQSTGEVIGVPMFA